MILRLDEIAKKAATEGYGIPSPNIATADGIFWCFETAANLRAPLIIGVSGKKGLYPGDLWYDLEAAGEFTKYMTTRYPEVPVCLNLDHCYSYEVAVQAIRNGFTSINMDLSDGPLEDNIKGVSEVVKLAHTAGVSVEGAIGGAVRDATADEIEEGLTSVEEAKAFVEATGVDALAVAVGSNHGDYFRANPVIRHDLIKELKKALPDTILVMHGTSYTGDAQLAQAAPAGITKFNVYGELSDEAMKEAGAIFAQEKHHRMFADAQMAMKTGYQRKLEHFMKLYGCVGTV